MAGVKVRLHALPESFASGAGKYIMLRCVVLLSGSLFVELAIIVNLLHQRAMMETQRRT